jgi:hypothetical protein
MNHRTPLAFGLATSAALLTACHGSELPPPEPSSVIVRQSNPEIIPGHGTQLPKELPEAIGKLVSGAVAVQLTERTKVNGLDATIEAEYGSGFRIDKGHVLTAGHAIIEKNGTLMSKVALCGGVEVDAATEQSNGENGLGQPTYGAKLRVNKVAGSFKADAANSKAPDANTPDVAVLGIMDEIGAQPPVNFRHTPLKAGEPVYFVGYPPVISTQQKRTPYQGDLLDKDQSTLSKPAIYGGVVARDQTQAGSKLPIVTGLQSYGAIEHAHSVGGDSGEIALDQQGEIIGITSSALEMPESLAVINGLLGVSVQEVAAGLNPDAVQYSNIQTLSAEIVQNWVKTSDNAPNCTQ